MKQFFRAISRNALKSDSQYDVNHRENGPHDRGGRSVFALPTLYGQLRTAWSYVRNFYGAPIWSRGFVLGSYLLTLESASIQGKRKRFERKYSVSTWDGRVRIDARGRSALAFEREKGRDACAVVLDQICFSWREIRLLLTKSTREELYDSRR